MMIMATTPIEKDNDMKTILNHIATKKVAKRVDRNTATKLGEFLLSEGYVKRGRTVTKGHHEFRFDGSGHHWVVSYRKLESKPQVMLKDRELRLEGAA